MNRLAHALGPRRLALATALATILALPAVASADFVAQYVEDVGHADGEEHEAGSSFEWAWRIRNAGSTDWTASTDVRLKLDGASVFGRTAPSDVMIAASGDDVVVTLTGLTAPANTGNYREYWHIYHGSTDFTVNKGFWVDIDVVPAEGGVDPGGEPGGNPLDAELEGHATIEPGSCVVLGRPATKTWVVKNTGSTPWGADTALVRISGDPGGTQERYEFTESVAAGASTPLSVEFTPSTPGLNQSVWQLEGTAPGGTTALFGPELGLSFVANSTCETGGDDGTCSGTPAGQTRDCCDGLGVETCLLGGEWSSCSTTCPEGGPKADDPGTTTGAVCSLAGDSGTSAGLLLTLALVLGLLRRRHEAR